MPDNKDPLHPKPDIVAWLNDLRPDEVEKLKMIVQLEPDVIKAMPVIIRAAAEEGSISDGVKAIVAALVQAKRVRAAGAVMQFILLSAIGTMGAVAAIPDQVKAVLHWISRSLGGGK